MSLGQTTASNDGAVLPAESRSPGQQSLAMLGPVSPEPAAPRAEDAAADPASDAEPLPMPKKTDPKLCGICRAQPGKYKCPRCSMPYCSVTCSRQHKENHPPDPPKPEPSSSAPNNNSIGRNGAQEDPYSILLEHRATFQRLFEQYPSLPTVLSRIQEKTLPPSDNNPNPSFSRLASSIPGLGTSTITPNTGRNRQQPWTKDVGLRRGAEALRKARTDPSDTGDGVREFCDLVLTLLAKKGGKKGGEAAVGRVREEVLAEETRVIERLLKEDGG